MLVSVTGILVNHGQTSACGCPDLSCYRIDEGQEKCFEFTTWVQYDNTLLVTRARLEEVQTNGTGGFIQLLAADRIRAVLNCATKSIDLPLGDIDRIKRTLAAMREMDTAARVAKTQPPAAHPLPSTSPIDGLRLEFELHEVACRREFYALVELSETEVAQIFANPQAVPSGFMESATLAMDLIREQCVCGAAKRKST